MGDNLSIWDCRPVELQAEAAGCIPQTLCGCEGEVPWSGVWGESSDRVEIVWTGGLVCKVSIHN